MPEEIMDEATRRNKIEKMSLKFNLESTYFTVTGILLAVFAFIQTSDNPLFIKGIYSLIITGFLIALIVKSSRERKEIDQLFQ